MNTADPFYNEEDFTISVYNSNTLMLRMEDINEERDTGYIRLPSCYVVEPCEKFRFYVVQNYSDYPGYENEFGIYVYAYDPLFNYKIKGCTFSAIKGRNTIELPPTIVTDSYVGVYRSPCYEIVNNESTVVILICLPNMTFRTNNTILHQVKLRAGQKRTSSAPKCLKYAKKLKEIRLGDELSTAYQNLMNEANYDVYFVVGDQKIGTFKFTLCAVSDVFKAAFKEHTKESQTGEIAIVDFDYEIVKVFVDALHTYKIYFDDDPIKTLKIKMMANKYNVTSIEKAAVNAFNVNDITRNNFVATYR